MHKLNFFSHNSLEVISINSQILCKNVMAKPFFKYIDNSIHEIIKTMKNKNTSFVPIINHDKTVAGIITQTDLITCILNNINFDLPINSYITKNFIYCYPNEDISYAISKMADYHIKQILIINDNYSLAGVISIKELALNSVTNKYLNELLYELFQEQTINPIKLLTENQKKI